MGLTARIVASEILMCGLKFGLRQIPIVGEPAAQVVEGLQKRHETLGNSAQMAEFEGRLSRVERDIRDTVERQIRSILGNLGQPALPGPELTREMAELRQIYENGWVPNLFEGLLRNSSHLEELRQNPKQYGRILRDDEPFDPENGMHLLIDKDKTRILELPASSLAFLLGNQNVGIPVAEVRASQDIWAFPSKEFAKRRILGPSIPARESDEPFVAVELREAPLGVWKGVTKNGYIRTLAILGNRSCELTPSQTLPWAMDSSIGGFWQYGEGQLFLEIPSYYKKHGSDKTSKQIASKRTIELNFEIVSVSGKRLKLQFDPAMLHFDSIQEGRAEEEMVKVADAPEYISDNDVSY